MESIPEIRWLPTARTNCNEAVGLSRAMLLRTLARAPLDMVDDGPPAVPAQRGFQILAGSRRRIQVHEPFTIIYSPAGCDHAADGRRATRGLGCVHATAGLDPSRSRLSDDTSCDVLSGRRSGCDGVVGDVSSGAAVRAGARTEPDDFDEFLWKLADYAAVRPRSKHRRGRAAGAGRDQFRVDVSADRSAESSDL